MSSTLYNLEHWIYKVHWGTKPYLDEREQDSNDNMNHFKWKVFEKIEQTHLIYDIYVRYLNKGYCKEKLFL